MAAVETAISRESSALVAQTGHVEISTLPTDDAPPTLMRNMGIAPFNIASSVILITARRLARRLCPNGKSPLEVPRKTLLDAGFKPDELVGAWISHRPVGRSACNNGHQGRGGSDQVMPRSPKRCSASSGVTARRWRSPHRHKPTGCACGASPAGTKSRWT